jgi:hypothetical protein
MIRSRASVPIAENMSAYRLTWSRLVLASALVVFLYLQKYERMSMLKTWHAGLQVANHAFPAKAYRSTARKQPPTRYRAIFVTAQLWRAPAISPA